MNSINGNIKKSDVLSTVELFSGIGGFRIACDALNIKTVWANDINVLACNIYSNVFGTNEIVQGDIRELCKQVPQHDLLTAGFPCQPFSSAGKKEGIRDPRGTLFEEIIKVLTLSSPQFFVLENVKRLLSMEGGDHFATILSALSELDYFVEWRLLNALDFDLPQNRQRIVIIGTRMQSIDSGSISLVNNFELKKIIQNDLGGLQGIKQWQQLEEHRKRFPSWGLCYKGKFYAYDINQYLTRSTKLSIQSILEKNPLPEFYMDSTTEKRIDSSIFINKFVNGVRILYNQKGGARMGYTIFGTDGVAPTLTASHSRHYERYKIGDRFRRLTNKEYARLQGFPDDHCATTSIFNQYGLYGNAVPPPLAKWVIQNLINNKLPINVLEPVAETQMNFEL